MTEQVRENWTIHEVAFRDAPGFGPDHPFARIDDLQTAGAPPLAASQKDVSALADALVQANRRFGNELAPGTIEAIRGGSPLVIAGQQPGLLLGPAFTLLKTVSAISLARRLSEEMGSPVIAGFWIAGEDHDVEEVNRCTIGDRKLIIHHPFLEQGGPRPAVAALSLEPWRAEITDFVAENLRDQPYRDWVVSLIETMPLDSYSRQFGHLLARLLGEHGLVLIEAMDMHALSRPIIARCVEQWPRLQAAFEQGTAELARRGFKPPLDRLTLFEITEAGRIAIDDPGSLDPAEICTGQRRFSPGAALRPIVQDALLNVSHTVAGPTELLYLHQIDPLYQVLGVERSRPVPRLSATFIDHRTAARAAKFKLAGAGILNAGQQLARGPAEVPPPEDDELKYIEQIGADLTRRIEALMDNHTRKPLTKSLESIQHQIGKVTERVRQHRLEQVGVGRRNLQRIADVVCPGGALQERATSAIELLAQYGPQWLDAMLESLDPRPRNPMHYVVEMPPVTVTMTQGAKQ